MSDPLTALMHAVQVMNLLKTLILNTLRKREEAAEGGYSPMSSGSSDRQSEGDYDSQQDDDDGDHHDHHLHDVIYSPTSEEDEEGDASSVSEIVECFLKRLDEKTKRFSEKPVDNNLESNLSFTDIKTENSCSSFSSEDDSRTTLTAEESNADTSSSSMGSTSTNDVEMIDKFPDPVSLVPLFASS